MTTTPQHDNPTHRRPPPLDHHDHHAPSPLTTTTTRCPNRPPKKKGGVFFVFVCAISTERNRPVPTTTTTPTPSPSTTATTSGRTPTTLFHHRLPVGLDDGQKWGKSLSFVLYLLNGAIAQLSLSPPSTTMLPDPSPATITTRHRPLSTSPRKAAILTHRHTAPPNGRPTPVQNDHTPLMPDHYRDPTLRRPPPVESTAVHTGPDKGCVTEKKVFLCFFW
jgi:hypothetical protein